MKNSLKPLGSSVKNLFDRKSATNERKRERERERERNS